MDTLVITWRELLIVVVLVLAVYIAEVLLLTRSGGKHWWRGRRNHDQRAELDALKGKISELDERLATIQDELAEMKRTQTSTPYSQAIQLAHQGLAASQISANCGISRAEAELIVALNKAGPT